MLPSRAAGPVLIPSALLLPLALLVATTAIVSPALAWRPWPGADFNTTGPGAELGASKKYEGSSEFVHLRYHMGPVLTANVTVHPIWYGAWSPPQQRIIRAFIRSISPAAADAALAGPSVAAWWRTIHLYTDQTGANITAAFHLGAEKNDHRCSHGRRLSRLTVQSVIRSAVTACMRPLPVNPRGGLYLVLIATEVAIEGFCGQVCGFHYFTFLSIVGYTLPYAWVGNSVRQCPVFCAYPFALPSYAPPGTKTSRPPSGGAGVDGMVSVVAHELAELASNPLANAWYACGDPSFPTEIADLCEGIYGTGGGSAYTGQLTLDARDGTTYNLRGVSGRRFLVQWVWNPVLNYCFGPNALDQQ